MVMKGFRQIWWIALLRYSAGRLIDRGTSRLDKKLFVQQNSSDGIQIIISYTSYFLKISPICDSPRARKVCHKWVAKEWRSVANIFCENIYHLLVICTSPRVLLSCTYNIKMSVYFERRDLSLFCLLPS